MGVVDGSSKYKSKPMAVAMLKKKTADVNLRLLQLQEQLSQQAEVGSDAETAANAQKARDLKDAEAKRRQHIEKILEEQAASSPAKVNPQEECRQLLKQAAIADSRVNSGDVSEQNIAEAIDLYSKFLDKMDMAVGSGIQQSKATADGTAHVKERLEALRSMAQADKLKSEAVTQQLQLQQQVSAAQEEADSQVAQLQEQLTAIQMEAAAANARRRMQLQLRRKRPWPKRRPREQKSRD